MRVPPKAAGLRNASSRRCEQLEVPGARDTVKVTVSVGVAEALPGEPADSWFARADRALYEAKAKGRDCVAIAADELVDRFRAAA